MSIQGEIDRINNNVSDALAAAAEMGASVPETANSNDLGRLIRSIPQSGGGGTSINVTAEVGQTIVVKAVDENGKPTAWESADYQPRTHWSETVDESVGVLPLVSVQIDETEGVGLLTTDNSIINYDALIAGNTYIVNWNGTEYECVLKYPPMVDDEGNIIGEDQDAGWMLGNFGLATGGEDTGEPFIILIGSYENDGISGTVVSMDGSASATISIKSVNKIENHTIDNKYLDLAWKPRYNKYVWVENFTLAAGEQRRIGEYTGDYDLVSKAIDSPDTTVMALVYVDGTPCEVEVRGTSDNMGVVIKGGDTLIAIAGPLGHLMFSNGDSLDHTFSVYFLEYEPIPDKFLTTKKYINAFLGHSSPVGGILTVKKSTEDSITEVSYTTTHTYFPNPPLPGQLSVIEHDTTRLTTPRFVCEAIQYYLAPLIARIEALENSTT